MRTVARYSPRQNRCISASGRGVSNAVERPGSKALQPASRAVRDKCRPASSAARFQPQRTVKIQTVSALVSPRICQDVTIVHVLTLEAFSCDLSLHVRGGFWRIIRNGFGNWEINHARRNSREVVIAQSDSRKSCEINKMQIGKCALFCPKPNGISH